jgi:HEAT repeat protein
MLLAATILVLAPQDELVEKLRSDSVVDRSEAERSLRALGRPALPALEKASRDPDREVAARARRLFHLIPALERVTPGLRRAMPDVERRLETGDPHAWTELLLAAVPEEADLGEPYRPLRVAQEDLSPIVGPALTHARPDEKAEVHQRTLQGWARGVAVDHLIRALDDPAVRGLALNALAERALRSAIPAIRPLIDDPEWNLAALNALSNLDARESLPHFLRLLAVDPSPWIIEKLSGSREAIPDLALFLRDDRDDLRKAAEEALAPLEAPPLAELLLERLEDPDPRVRSAALDSLRTRFPDRAALPARTRLKDPAPRVRESALWAILEVEDRRPVPDLLPLLRDPDPRNRSIAARAAGDLGIREAVPDLLEAIADPETQFNAVYALVRLAAPEAIPAFYLFVSDERPWLRARAVEGLSATIGSAAAPVFEALLEDPEHDVRGAAATAILDRAGSNGPALVPFLAHRDFQVRGLAVFRLSGSRDPAVAKAILPLLRNDRAEVRLAALEALRGTPDRKLLEQILPSTRDESPLVRRAAVGIQLRFAGEEDRARVAALLADPDFRIDAAEWLCARGFREGVPILLRERDTNLFLLNAVRRPAVWRRLAVLEIRRTGWSMDLSRVALAADLPLVFPQRRERDPNKKLLYGDDTERVKLIDALQEALRGSHDAVLEEDRIVVLPSSVALEFWEKWWDEESRKK